MIKHIMLWNYKDQTPAQERARIEAELASLPEQVSSLIAVQFGPVVGGRNQSFSHCFIMDFDDMAGLAEYNTHPAHIRFAGPFRVPRDRSFNR